MINKVSFPTTFITESSISAINRRLGRFAVYLPVAGETPSEGMARALAGSAIDVRAPVTGNEAYLKDVCRAYGKWGNVHQKNALRLNRLAGDGFYNQDFARDISSDILRIQAGGDPNPNQSPDHVFNARIFLQLAQEFDLSEFEIRQGLEKAENASKQMFEQLRGENPVPGEFGGSGGEGSMHDAGAIMTGSRLAAWALLAVHDTIKPDIFVTDSPAVMEMLMERLPDITRVGTFDTVSEPDMAEASLSERLGAVAGNPWPGEDAAAGIFSYLEKPARDGYVLDVYAAIDSFAENVLGAFTDVELRPRSEAGSNARHVFFCCVRLKK